MLKFSRLLLHSSRDLLSRKSLINEATSNFKLLRCITTQTGTAATTPKFGPDRISSDFTFFKGKAALSSHPVLPTFIKLDSGGHRIDRCGVIMLTFWPAIGERKYNWEKRQNFALSATEVGSLINLGSTDSCEFFHDPSMKSSNAGQVRKSLSVKAHADGSGYMFNLSVVNNLLNTNDRLSVPVTGAEFAVLRTAFAFALPHIIGWKKCLDQPLSVNQSSRAPVTNPTASEWDR